MELISGSAVFGERTSKLNLRSAKWSPRFLKVFAKEVWKDYRMKDARIKILIPALKMDGEEGPEVKVFHNIQSGGNEEDLVSDVVLRSSAAPTYFPAHQNYVDGGMFAHSPAPLAICELINSGVKNSEIYCLSFSTGRAKHNESLHSEHNYNWGVSQWIPRLPTVLWDGMIQHANILSRSLLGERFYRIDPMLEKELPMDDPELLPVLSKVGKDHNLEECFEWIQKNFYE